VRGSGRGAFIDQIGDTNQATSSQKHNTQYAPGSTRIVTATEPSRLRLEPLPTTQRSTKTVTTTQ
jgi:hypothetical protein